METLLKHEAPDSLLQYSGIKSAVESLLPYTGESRCRDGLSLRSPPVLSIFLLWLGLKRRETFAPCSGELSLLWCSSLHFFLCRAPFSETEPIATGLHVHWFHVAKHEAGWCVPAGRCDFVTLLPPVAPSGGESLNCFPTRCGNWNIPVFYNKFLKFEFLKQVQHSVSLGLNEREGSFLWPSSGFPLYFHPWIFRPRYFNKT